MRPRLEAKLVEILWLAHVQRAQQHRIHYSEDEDVCPNPQHQSEYGYQRERGRLPKHAQRITNILQQVGHEWQASIGRTRFCGRERIIEIFSSIGQPLSYPTH